MKRPGYPERGLLPALLMAAGLLSGSPPARAENPAVTGAPVLQIPMGSRAMGMGGAFTAVGSDASALYYNPAGMSRLTAHELGFTFLSGLAGDDLQNIAYAGPLPFAGLSGNGYASAGASLLFSRNGQMEVNQFNADGTLNSSNQSAGSDFVAAAGYSERVGSTPLEFKDAAYGINHFMGISGKYIRSTLAGGYSAQTFAADAGYLAVAPETGLSLGASLLNLGGKMKFISEGDPLPLTARGGLAYQFGVPSVHNVILAADGEYYPYEKKVYADLGMEYFWVKTYGLRLGYQFLRDAPGLTIGFGLRWRGRIMLDYAWGMAYALSDTHRVTLSYRFGGVAPGARGRLRRPFIESSPDQDALKGRTIEDATPAPVMETQPEQRPSGVPGWIY